ncbi:MAG TPA: transcription termination factor Rho [Verrucomicrobiae bacterium]|nr:transcription termination factor Rho [Verrucomicrobiae bacterium]
MDEKLEASAPRTETVETGVSPANAGTAAETVATTATVRSIDLNELQEFSDKKLKALARELSLHLHPARSRHQHILDLIRAALTAGATVSGQGFLDQISDSFAMLRWPNLNFLPVPEDVCVPRALIEQYGLRPGQKLAGTLRLPVQREKFLTLERVTTIEDQPAEQWQAPFDFDKLTPQFPQGRIMLENPKTDSISARAVDLLAPLGRGQRGLIVAPPRVGKTILLKEIAKAIRVNHPDIVLILLLVDERPEEVTDLKREVDPLSAQKAATSSNRLDRPAPSTRIAPAASPEYSKGLPAGGRSGDCQIYHSNFDESVQRHVHVAEMVLERAKRLVELKQDVVLLLDSLTRLSRGYNNLQSGKGRIMSGGVEAKALIKPKKFFGSARNVEEGGSLTVLATALTETGSRMDELIFEEFKGTGNMELHLDRALQEKRLYPAIHPLLSATRREDLLYHPDEWERVQELRKIMATLPPLEAMEKLIDNLHATKTNAELLLSGLR